MSESDHDEDDLPSAEECQKASEEFATITGTDTALAMFYLQGIDLRISENNWCELENYDWGMRNCMLVTGTADDIFLSQNEKSSIYY